MNCLIDAFAYFAGDRTLSAGGIVGAHAEMIGGPYRKIGECIRGDVAHIDGRTVTARGSADVDLIACEVGLSIGIPRKRRGRV